MGTRGYKSRHAALRHSQSLQGQAHTIWPTTVAILLLLPGFISSQGVDSLPDDKDLATASPEKLEHVVVSDILKIVDRKFDTLTTRITSLERAVSNLQFFSIRQFRQMGGSLQNVAGEVKSLGKQVGQLEVDARGVKITTSLIHREVSELRSMSSDLSDRLDTSMTSIGSNMERQTEILKVKLHDTLLRSGRDSTKRIQDFIEMVLDDQKESVASEPGNQETNNCTVDFIPVYEHFDNEIRIFKKEMNTSFYEFVNVKISEDLNQCEAARERETQERKELKSALDKAKLNEKVKTSKPVNGSVKAYMYEGTREKEHPKQSTTSHVKPGRYLGASKLVPAPKSQDGAQVSTAAATQDDKDAQIMEALANMTMGVQQAVSFFRSSSHMLELIVSNTDMLVNRQLGPQETASNPDGLVSTGARAQVGQQLRVVADGPGGSNQKGLQTGVPVYIAGSAQQKDCGLPAEIMGGLTTVIKNGSQLLEILTDLAQMSSYSLRETASTLQDEIKRIEGVRTRMATKLLRMESDSTTKEDNMVILLNQVANMTTTNRKLIDAVASNTGWLPLIYSNVQKQGEVTNRTLNYVSRTHSMVRELAKSHRDNKQQEQELPPRPTEGEDEDDPDHENDPSISNRINNGPGAVVSRGRGHGLSKEEFTLDERSMETIYSTSLQLNRIMPALTKLLAEPDPLFALVGGGRPDQGRVEIYHKGKWGALCHQELSHAEADVICRHLGFQGGVSAGSGHFGAGGGVTWSLNASCLASADCAAVTHETSLSGCSHEKDEAVICDHMIRIVSLNGTTGGKRGRVEMHHRGVWHPVCGQGWTGHAARVACRQLAHNDGREIPQPVTPDEDNNNNSSSSNSTTTWLTGVRCRGVEARLDLCSSQGWTDTCPTGKPAGMRCF